MINNVNILYTIILCFLITACEKKEATYDASGSFEATERIISSLSTGKIIDLNIEEGQVLKANTIIGHIDVQQLELQRDQVNASVHAISKKTTDAGPKLNILEAELVAQDSKEAILIRQIEVLDVEIDRFRELVASYAAPQKQLDDLFGQRSILQKQLEGIQTQKWVIQQQMHSAESAVKIQNRSILSEIEPTKKKLDLIAKQIKDGIIINEFNGTVLTKYAYNGEFASMGKPLYKIADLSEMHLKAYITNDQLAKIKLNDKVIVMTDDGSGGFKETTGIVEWISSKAEFTPKTIQTKEERANLVYAIKVKIINDGFYKIGMYGEIKFKNND